MKRVLLVGCALLFSVSLYADSPGPQNKLQAASKVTARAWPHELSDIKPDARVTWGKLENGLRYAIMPTKTAPTRGSLRMFLQVGSAMEADDQQGMAHFVEHMAFNGTKHFPAGETLEYFQRLGMSFGAHTNASTQIDHTVYQLELPRANEKLTSDGLKLFRDFLDGMLLDAKEIDKERGVVLSEQIARNTPTYRNACSTASSRRRNGRRPACAARSTRRRWRRPSTSSRRPRRSMSSGCGAPSPWPPMSATPWARPASATCSSMRRAAWGPSRSASYGNATPRSPSASPPTRPRR